MHTRRSLPDVSGRLALSGRWTPLAAFGAGLISATGFAPLALWPLTLAALAFLLHLIAQQSSVGRVALIGWLFGVGHFVVGNNWIATAFTYQAEMPAWLGWIAVFLLALYLAVYPMLAGLGAWYVARRSVREAGWPLVFAFAGSWTIAEWLRSWVFTGYVWNPLGMVTLGGFTRPGLAAIAPWFGTYALSAVVVVLAGCWWRATQRVAPGHRAALLAVPLAAMLLPLLVPHDRPQGTLAFTLVQPHIPQEELTDPTKYESQFGKTAALTLARKPGTRRLVLWPESGVPDYLRPGYPQYFYAESTFAADPDLARERIGRVMGPNSVLMTGAVDLIMGNGHVVAATNSVTALDSRGDIVGSYAKAHLVPYGEYLPMRALLEPLGLSRLVAGSLDFWPGPGPRTIDLGAWGKAGVQICYEIIFSGQVVDRAHRPDYIFNPSNDGWFGAFGPPQHLAQARMRAIEEGLPVLRATTTGISAIVDANGIVRQFLPLGRSGRIDGFVPPAHAPTPFARLGNMLPLGWALVLLAGSAIALRRRRR